MLAALPHRAVARTELITPRTMTVPGPGKDPANWGYPCFYVHFLPGWFQGQPPVQSLGRVPASLAPPSWSPALPPKTSAGQGVGSGTLSPPPAPAAPSEPDAPGSLPPSPRFPGVAPQLLGRGLPGTPTLLQGPSPLLGYWVRPPRARDAQTGGRRIQPQGIRGAS